MCNSTAKGALPDMLGKHNCNQTILCLCILTGAAPVGARSRSRMKLSCASRGKTVMVLLMLQPSCRHHSTDLSEWQLLWFALDSPKHDKQLHARRACRALYPNQHIYK